MAINKTAAGTFVVDFRDKNGKRIRKTFPTYKRASDYDKEVVAQVSRGDFILPSKDTVKDIAESGTRGRRRPALIAFQFFRTGERISINTLRRRSEIWQFSRSELKLSSRPPRNGRE
jgi:hypothetical protein